MAEDYNGVLAKTLGFKNLEPVQLDRLIYSTLRDKNFTQEYRQNRIRIIAAHVTKRLSDLVSVTTLTETINSPEQTLPDNLQTILMSKEFLGLRKILNKLISSKSTQILLSQNFMINSKELLGIFETLEEKHYFILTNPKLDTLEAFFKKKNFTIDQNRIGPKTINNKIMELLNDNPDELTPDFLRACVAFVAASKPYGSPKSLGKQRTIDKLDTLDQQVISGITNLVNSLINGILETAEASEKSYNDRDTKSRLDALLAGKDFEALEKMLRGLIHLKPVESDENSPNTDAPLIVAINAASKTLKSLNDLRAEIREETPTALPTILKQFSDDQQRTAS